MTDPAGNPIPDICFNSTLPQAPLSQSLARTDTQGRYRIDRDYSAVLVEPCDANEWAFSWQGQLVPGGPLHPGTLTTKDIVLTQKGGVRGIVTTAAGAPVPDVCVSTAGGEYSDLAERTGADGRFAIHNADPGTSTPNLHECLVYGRRLPLTPQTYTVHPGQWTDVTLVMPSPSQ